MIKKLISIATMEVSLSSVISNVFNLLLVIFIIILSVSNPFILLIIIPIGLIFLAFWQYFRIPFIGKWIVQLKLKEVTIRNKFWFNLQLKYQWRNFVPFFELFSPNKAEYIDASKTENDIIGIIIAKRANIYRHFSDAELHFANLQGAFLGGAIFLYNNFSGRNLRGIHLPLTNLTGFNFQKANLQESFLLGTILKEADLRKADLENACLPLAALQGADLRGANLRKAMLFSSQLQGADFQGANLRKAILNSAQLQGADLRGVNLIEANLHKADLREANLQKAKFKETNLQEAFLNGAKVTIDFFDIMPDIARIQTDDETYIISTEDNQLIYRSIEFPSEYKQAGISILNYFSEICEKNYPESNATVFIKQDGLKVTMIIDPVDGEKKIIEKMLDEYGLVVTGRMTPEEFTSDKKMIMELKQELYIAQERIRFQNAQISDKNAQMDKLFSIVADAVKRDHNINVYNINTDGDATVAQDNAMASILKTTEKN